ncbi:MAG TPA: hypothetical protein VEJ87_06800 [Acidimicrobiales bacterium]|nr:hypothetical protein [Acidimicrobiales bacterium]
MGRSTGARVVASGLATALSTTPTATTTVAVPRSRRLGPQTHFKRRIFPIVATAVTLIAGMSYTLLNNDAGRIDFWTIPGDIWSTFRSAQYVGWGNYAGIYSVGNGLVTFPGIVLLLTPVAMLSGALGLGESYPFSLPHPTSWLILGPYEILFSSTALFACDSLAERIGVNKGRRFWLCAAEAVVLWNVDVVWGHPEDALALALAVYSLLAAMDGRWRRCGWLFGAAIAVQPLVILMFPVLVAMGGRGEVAGLCLRSALPAAALLALPLSAHFHQTMHAVLDQPNFPLVDHITPWTSLAPSLGGRGKGLAVAAGPGRVFAVLLACAVGFWARRWRSDPAVLVVASATALGLRCLTESVMVSFYLWPPLALGLVACARSGLKRFTCAAVLASFVTVFSDFRPGPWWLWWLVVTLGLFGVVGMSLPGSRVKAATSEKNPSSSEPEMPEQVPKMVPC